MTWCVLYIQEITILIICAILHLSLSCFPEVKTNNGWVRGIPLQSRFNRTFFSFKGIPYARPPVGSLRFKKCYCQLTTMLFRHTVTSSDNSSPDETTVWRNNIVAPEPIGRWDGILNATYDRPPCIQLNILFAGHKLVGDEDCLVLNVNTPWIPQENCRIRLPVLVYFHYGGFFAGSSQSIYQGPEYFMDEDVVLVTFNYRLGIFGFLSTNDDAAPGNWALKDQVAVLKWVQDNIGYFGGDKNKVTIFGQSAGASSVHLQMLSPLSKGLFHRAISQSGTAFSAFARPIPALSLIVARQQALFVGCNGNSTTNALVECLRDIDAQILAESVDNFKFFADEPSVVFMPSIEKQSALNPHPFITQDPIEIVKNGNFNRIPWIVGFVENEGLVKAAALLRNQTLREELAENFDSYGPLLLGLSLSSSANESNAIWSKISDFYIGEPSIDISKMATLQGFIDMYGDRFFNYPSYRAIELHLLAGHEALWVYSFNYKGEYSYVDHFAHTTKNSDLIEWGVSHCDDLLYLFPSPALFPQLDPYSSDFSLSAVLIQMWTNFAENANPNVFFDLEWYPANYCIYQINGSTDFCYLNITGSYNKNLSIFHPETSFLTSRLKFWSDLPLQENSLYKS